MARVLVIYGTTYGQTEKIARAVGDVLRAQGHDTDVVTPASYDGVIVAASVQAGGYQKPVRRWVRTYAEGLSHKPNAFVSVCLGVLQKDEKVDAHLRSIVEAFTSATGWRPNDVAVMAGALPYRSYDWVTRWLMKRIVSKAGGDTDTSRDYEYTDWTAVRAFADQFAHRLNSARAEVEPGVAQRRVS
jgi:menaquinone-dependent protoporphyrinogen oxidase